jgi:hypothetical protein
MYWYDPGDRRLSLLPANHCQLKESSLFVIACGRVNPYGYSTAQPSQNLIGSFESSAIDQKWASPVAIRQGRTMGLTENPTMASIQDLF